MKKILVVVDFQNDFVDGSLGFPGAEKLEEPILKLVKEYSANGHEVVFTTDVHEEDYLETEEGKHLPIIHCQRGSKGALMYGKIQELSKGYKVFDKGAFGSDLLLKHLQTDYYDEIDICGLDSSICVTANAVVAKVACPNAHIRVLAYASGSGDKTAEEHAYKALERLQIEIVRKED